MDKNFSLIQQLEREKNAPKKQNELPPGVEYQEYTIVVEDTDQIILIPIRECQAFETTLSLQDKYLNRDDLRVILRKHRGIRR